MANSAEIKTEYQFSPFDSEKASNGSLVAMIDKNANDTAGFSEDNPLVKGVGRCFVDKFGNFDFYIGATQYTFTSTGAAYNIKTSNWKLVMATIKDMPISKAGSAVHPKYSTVVTRVSDTVVKTITEYASQSEDANVIVGSLNARDQFAIQVLNGMISHIEDPVNLDEQVILHYCQAAYRWAAGMMTSAASVRSTFVDETEAPEVATVNELESNTEKLLNNMNVILTTSMNDLGDKVKRGFADVVEALSGNES